MNKPLKFRICYTDRDGKKSMIYSDDNRFLIGLNGKVYENYGKDWKNPTWEEVFDANETPIIQQYTGLKDQHNKEIYEGDIMASRGNYITDEIDENGNFPDLKNVVIWNVNSTRFALKPIEHYVRQLRLRQLGRPIPVYLDSAWACSLTTFKEVIGNIFENPELLKQYES